jgi:hypothetical protein
MWLLANKPTAQQEIRHASKIIAESGEGFMILGF